MFAITDLILISTALFFALYSAVISVKFLFLLEDLEKAKDSETEARSWLYDTRRASSAYASALSFYADRQNWVTGEFSGKRSNISADRGETAKLALGGYFSKFLLGDK